MTCALPKQLRIQTEENDADLAYVVYGYSVAKDKGVRFRLRVVCECHLDGPKLHVERYGLHADEERLAHSDDVLLYLDLRHAMHRG